MINCSTCKIKLYHRQKGEFCVNCKKERNLITKKRAKYMDYYKRLLSDGFTIFHKIPIEFDT